VQGRVDVQPISAADAARPAPRPANSALVSERWQAAGLRPLPDWERALRDYLGEGAQRR
jgi:dTDP-4-dehydrorhamnose reductase